MDKSGTKNPKLAEFQKKIKINFIDVNILKTALTHRSFLNENKEKSLQHNERLEFLGDAVLEFIITELLFQQYPDKTEGDLTSFRAATVKTPSLAESALSLNLGNYLYLSKGEEATGGRKRQYILANAFEALIGAIYLDQGIKIAHKFLNKYLFPKIKNIIENRLDIDNKSKLQEVVQEELGLTPSYQLISETGPDHNKNFEMGVVIGTVMLTKGTGQNKQEAEQQAAAQALKSWSELRKQHFN